jgi:hypothetical protein
MHVIPVSDLDLAQRHGRLPAFPKGRYIWMEENNKTARHALKNTTKNKKKTDLDLAQGHVAHIVGM